MCVPTMISPVIFGSGHGKHGFYGIQTMNFQMSMASAANRAWRSIFPKMEVHIPRGSRLKKLKTPSYTFNT